MPNNTGNAERKPLGSVEGWDGLQRNNLVKLFGSAVSQHPANPRKNELDEIRLTAPESLGEKGEAFVALLTIGASIHPEYLKDARSTSSTGGVNDVKFNQDNLLSNVTTGDERFLTQDYADAMLRGRIDAANALAQYRKGNYDAVKTALGRALEEIYDLGQELTIYGTSVTATRPALGALALVEELRDAKLPFELRELLPEPKWTKLEANFNLCRIHADVLDRIEAFQAAPGGPGSPERQQMLSQIALGLNMTEFYSDRQTVDGKATRVWLDDTLRKAGIEIPKPNSIPRTQDYMNLTGGKYHLFVTADQMRTDLRNNSLTGLEYAYSRPDAAQWFEKKFMERVTQLPAYRELLNEPDSTKLAAGMQKLVKDISDAGGMRALARPEDLAEFEKERARLDGAAAERKQQGQAAKEERVADALETFRKGERLRGLLLQSARALGESAATAGLWGAMDRLMGQLDAAPDPELEDEEVQRGLRDVARFASAYARSVREKAGKLSDENWEPRSAADRKAYRAAKSLENDLVEYALPLPAREEPQNEAQQQPFRARSDKPFEILRELKESREQYGYKRTALLTLTEKREIDRTVQLFAAIPPVNTDKAVDALLAREERYRAEHVLDQDETTASAVRTVMLLAVKKSFAPREGEPPAETARRHRAMKEALSERRVVDNMIDLYVDKTGGAYSPVEGVVLKDAIRVVDEAALIANDEGRGATTRDMAEVLNWQLAQVTPYADAGEEKTAFYEGSADFERQLLGGDAAMSPENAQAYQKVSESIKGLNDLLEPFYERNGQGELPTLTEEDFTRIRDGYRTVLDELQQFSQQASQSGRPLDMRRRELMDKFREKLGQDVIALEAGKQLGLSTLPNILLGANLPAAEIDGSPETVGELASTRLRVDLPGPGGSAVKGFFTPASFVVRSEEKALRELMDRETAEHPEWRSVMEKFFRADDPQKGGRGYLSNLGPNSELEQKMRAQADQSGLFDKFYPDKLAGAEFNAVRSHGFSMALYRVAKAFSAQKGMLQAYRGQGLLSGNLDKRNSAMTTVADLLNVPGLVAPARSVTVKIDGKETVGTFMAFAEGEDLVKTAPGSPLARVRAEDMLTPESVSAIADLQVLDYVCGNVDRHSRNLFYQMDTSDPQRPKCVGVQGIDNDFSFCANAHGKNLADIMNMKIIREDTAKALFTMNPGMLRTVLGGYDLSGEEIDAALKRVGELKQAVENKTLRVVTDEQIKTMNYATELLGNKNYFDRMLAVPRTARRRAFEHNSGEMDRAYQELRDNTVALGSCYTGLVDANRGAFVGSSEFRSVKADMEDLIASRGELLNGRDPQRLALYLQKLEKLRADMEKYLQKKEEEARKSKPSKRAEKRVAAVRALSDRIALERQSLNRYLSARQMREAALDGSEEQAARSRIEQTAMLEEDVYKARGAAKDLFPKLANRENPLLRSNGATLQAEAEAVFVSALEPETPELRGQRERLYAGLIADRILQKRMEAGGEAAQAMLSAWKKDPKLFEKTRDAVMQAPGFREWGAGNVHAALHKSLADPETLDRVASHLEQGMAEQAAALKKQGPAKEQNAPQQQAGQKAPDIKKAPVAPMA